MARSGNCYTNSGGKRKKVAVVIISLAACFLCGCRTTLVTYGPDGKTRTSETTVGMGHDVELPGAKVVSSPTAVGALKEAGIALGSAALKLLGERFTDKAFETMKETVNQPAPAPTVEEKVNPGGP